MPRRNEEVAQFLGTIAKLLSLKGEDPFRIRAYEEAARAIGAFPEDIDEVHRASRLEEIPGVGGSIAAKIGEYLSTGRSAYLEGLKRQVPAATDLLEVSSIGPARARLISQRLGITTVPELVEAARAHRLRALPGIGAKLEEKIAREAARATQRSARLPLGVALPAAEEVVRLLQNHPAVREIEPAGSIRRRRETVGDIDILASSDQPEAVMDAFTSLPIVQEVLTKGPTFSFILTRGDLQIDLRVIHPDEYGSALLHFTGSKDHNIALRNIVLDRGCKLSEYGLFDPHDRRIASRTEEEIYHALGMDWIPPELRENRGEIEAAQQHRLPDLVELREIRGDLHTHTNWSDGFDTPEHLVEAAIARGYEYIAFTEHSRSLRVAGGLTIERVREQRQLIDRLNDRYAPFRILHGTEVNILADGRLDYPDDVLTEFDIVTASIHSAFDQPPERITARIVRALENPHVDVLNHPTGRVLFGRPGHQANMDVVIRTAAENGVALEINGQPYSLDLDDILARRAKDAGAMLVCNSDAHSAQQLDYVRFAVATARRGWVERRGVLNTLSRERLLAHLRRRGSRARAA